MMIIITIVTHFILEELKNKGKEEVFKENMLWVVYRAAVLGVGVHVRDTDREK